MAAVRGLRSGSQVHLVTNEKFVQVSLVAGAGKHPLGI